MRSRMGVVFLGVAVVTLLSVMPGTLVAQSPQHQSEGHSPGVNPFRSRTSGSEKFPSRIKYVWIILMENHNWTGNNAAAAIDDPDIKGSRLAPYINGWLVDHSAYANQYYNPPKEHPSNPNYLWLEAGTDFGIKSDASPLKKNIHSHAHIERLLDAKGISWKAYAEQDFGNPKYDDCPLTFKEVDVDHVPAVYFADDTSNFSASSAYCIAHVRPYSEMARDLADGNVAHYNFVTPNTCHDGHEHISPCDDQESKNNTLRSDQWLKRNVPLITNSPQYKRAGVLFIVWDEAEDSGAYSDGPIPMFILSPFAKGAGEKGYDNSIHYDHSSMLKTVQEIFGLEPLLGAAADPNTRDLSDFFDLQKLQR